MEVSKKGSLFYTLKYCNPLYEDSRILVFFPLGFRSEGQGFQVQLPDRHTLLPKRSGYVGLSRKRDAPYIRKKYVAPYRRAWIIDGLQGLRLPLFWGIMVRTLLAGLLGHVFLLVFLSWPVFGMVLTYKKDHDYDEMKDTLRRRS